MAVGTLSEAEIAAAMVIDPTPLAAWAVILPLAVPIISAALLVMVRHSIRVHARIALAALSITLVMCVSLLWQVATSGPLTMTMGSWLPPFGISFTADLTGALFATTSTFASLACAIYALRDIDNTGRRYGFFAFLLLLAAGVNGSFLTGDIFNLYVWFEIFVISSFGLMILGSKPLQLDGAVKYAILNLIATTAFLIAVAMLYGIFGTLNMADIARQSPTVAASAPMVTLAALFFMAFGMKAGAFPLNFWLPASYHTPRIVVSALFGGLLTKVGIYALLRALTTLMPDGRAAIAEAIAWVAILTMMIGVLGALAQSDIRRILGFIVVSGIGVMMAGLALGSPEALAGTVLYAVHSIIVTTALYLLAGIIKTQSGSYSLHEASGLYTAHPLLAAIAFALVLAMAGLPPLSGLWPKVMLVQSSLGEGQTMLAAAILVSGFLTTIALGRIFTLAFWRARQGGGDSEPVKADSYAVLIALVIPALAIGLYPEPFMALAQEAARGLADPSSYIGSVFPGGGE